MHLFEVRGRSGDKSGFLDTHVSRPGGDLVSIMIVCVCPKVKEMGSFLASSE